MIKRRPPLNQPLTPAAIAAFKRMRELENECTCAPDAFADTRCAACKEWWVQHSKLHDELRCQPWDWPCVENPDVKPDWPSDPDAQARWRALMEAVTSLP